MTDEWVDGFKRALADALGVDARSDVPTLLHAAKMANSAGREEERALIVRFLRDEGEADDGEDGDLMLDLADMLESGLHYGEDDA